MSESSSRGWIVTLSGTGINLALGVLYTWSVISKNIPAEWGWSEANRALPYTVACLLFAIMMVPAGKLQDRFGPRMVACFGGIMTGLGLILASQFTGLGMFILGFGILAGTGIGFAYSAATPAAVKWFPAAKSGMITGIVVSGFGLASVYIAPLANYMIHARGLQSTMFILGIAFLVLVFLLSLLLVNPPTQAAPAAAKGAVSPPAVSDEGEYSPMEMMKTSRFYLLWFMFFFNAGAGLMIIGKLAKLVEVQANFSAGFILVALLAIGNAGGRLIAGTFSDKFGRIKVLQAFTAFQCLLMFITPFVSNAFVLVIVSMCIGMNYGSNLALFPPIVKDYFGIKNFGLNYGLVFTSWGAGAILALFAGKIYDVYGKFDYALYVAGALLVVTVIFSVVINKISAVTVETEQKAAA
jgi:OFA family oxalate/formate antiporter-like MFS transporter